MKRDTNRSASTMIPSGRLCPAETPTFVCSPSPWIDRQANHIFMQKPYVLHVNIVSNTQNFDPRPRVGPRGAGVATLPEFAGFLGLRLSLDLDFLPIAIAIIHNNNTMASPLEKFDCSSRNTKCETTQCCLFGASGWIRRDFKLTQAHLIFCSF